MALSPRLPATMLTQHPDSASRYVPIQDEPAEAVHGLLPAPHGLGADEVMVDFEGKLTPYHQPSQIVMALLEKGLVPGRDVFVTPRIASASKETVFRQLMALMSLVETNVQAADKGTGQAVIEVIVPMCETADDILAARRRIASVIELAHKEFGLPDEPDLIRIIPLVEGVPELLTIDSLFRSYLSALAGGARRASPPAADGGAAARAGGPRGSAGRPFRYFLGRSDPALCYGMVAATLAGKVALHRAAEAGREFGLEVAPILGAGALPFRGHVTLENLDGLLATYPGIRTITIQSALRYDHGEDKVRRMAARLRQDPPSAEPAFLSTADLDELHNFVAIFSRHYLETFSGIIELVARLSDFMPRQRDRLTRYSAVGYARDTARPGKLADLVPDPDVAGGLRELNPVVGVPLPRAIAFTASLYTIGFPPEFIGTGRALSEIAARYGAKGINALVSRYPTLRSDLAFAGRFLDLDIARSYLELEVAAGLERDLRGIRDTLDLVPGPSSAEDEFYLTLVETVRPILKHILGQGRELLSSSAEEARLVTDWIVRMGKIRGSLG